MTAMTAQYLFSQFALLVMLSAVPLSAADAAPRHYDLYLLIGQSNMAGRGLLDAESKNIYPRVFAFDKAGTWQPAQDPLHFDKKEAAVGPGLAFGKAMAEADPQAVIGLIPCAVGGSAIAQWVPGGQEPYTKLFPYDETIRRVRLAQQSGTLKAILWHQGEADRGAAQRAVYGEKLTDLVKRLRSDLNVPDVPFIAGELALLDEHSRNSTTEFNRVVNGLVGTIPLFACVPANDLHDKGDHLHLDTASARTFGKRYAEVLLKLRQKP